jgi:hypothetical protein
MDTTNVELLVLAGLGVWIGTVVLYGSCLTVGATPRGLYLAALFIFRIGHPPLFMPWTDISIGEQRGWWFNYVVLRFRRAPSIPLQVSEQLGRCLADRAGPAWPARGQASSQ